MKTLEKEDAGVVKKIIKLVEVQNFCLEAWMPLLDNIHQKDLRDFLSAFRCYAEYISTVGYDGILPKRAYVLALKKASRKHKELVRFFDKRMRLILKKRGIDHSITDNSQAS